MPDPKFDEYEIELLRNIATAFDAGNNYMHLVQLSDQVIKDVRYTALKERLTASGLITNELVGHVWITKITPELVALVHRIDNPPPVDHWKHLTVWFKSQRWSLPVLALFVGLPALYAWVQAIVGLIQLIFSGPTP